MPDYSLFGDEHVEKCGAASGKVGHDWNDTTCLPVVLLRSRWAPRAARAAARK